MSGFSPKILGLPSCRKVGGRARWMIHIFSLVCLMLATTSCGWVRPRADAYKDSKEYSETEFRKAESTYYKNSSTPQFCIALSGGGIRSAAYSIGVVKGLHVIKRQVPNRLPNIDIISAVSGGSYAATWLYDQYARQVSSGASGLNRLDRLDRVLSGPSIEAVAGNVTFFNLFQGFQSTHNFLEGNDVKFIQAVGTGDLMHGLLLYGWGLGGSMVAPIWKDQHQSQSGSDYENNIGRAFQAEPDSEKRLSLQTASRDLDLPISVENPHPGLLANEIFEFTSLGMGSPSVGYRSWTELKPEDRAKTYTFSRVASISGAAVHKATFTFAHVKLLQWFGRDFGLGYAILTPTYTNYTKDWMKRFVLLTDGGDSENLGAYGLTKRDCKEILVVDAEYDGEIGSGSSFIYGNPPEGYQDGYQFKAYRCLKQKLDKEGMQLSINELDRATNGLNCEGGKTPQSEAAPETSSDKLNCWNKSVNTKRAWFGCSEPISEGQLRGQKTLGVTYVKLSANRKLLDQSTTEDQNTALEVYGKRITDSYKTLITSDNDFPHYSTFKKKWAKEEFLAIAELGCRAVVRHYTPGLLSPRGEACIDIDKVTTPGTPGKK